MLHIGTQCSENKISASALADNELCTYTRHRHGKDARTTTATDGTTHFRWHEMHDVNERIDEGRSLYLAKPTQSLLFSFSIPSFHDEQHGTQEKKTTPVHCLLGSIGTHDN